MESSPLPTPSGIPESQSSRALNDHADRVLGPECPKAPTVVSVTSGEQPKPVSYKAQGRTYPSVFGGVSPVVPQYPSGKPVKQMLRPMGEFQSSLTLDQVIRQNERLIDALIRTNHNLMQMCERLVRSGPSDDVLDPFEEIERLQRQVERVKQKRDDEERGKKRHGGK